VPLEIIPEARIDFIQELNNVILHLMSRLNITEFIMPLNEYEDNNSDVIMVKKVYEENKIMFKRVGRCK
jgi:hypothetical protein